jgi:hypothetical protein
MHYYRKVVVRVDPGHLQHVAKSRWSSLAGEAAWKSIQLEKSGHS